MPRKLALGVALVLWASATYAAAAIVISPVAVHLSPARPVGEVRLANKGAAAVTIQSAAALWTQADGADRYADTSDILVAPAIATIRPGGVQIFRVALRGAWPSEKEGAYRLILEDVTPPKPGGGVQMRIRNNLPLFVTPRPGDGRPVVTTCAAPSKGLCLRVENRGGHYFKVTRVILEAAGKRREEPATASVLAGSWRRLFFDLDVPRPAKVTVETSAGSVSTVIPGSND